MQQIEISNLPSQLSDLLTAISQGEEVVLTQSAQPVAKVIKFPPIRKPRKAGSAEGQIFMAPDFDEPLEDFKEYME